MTTNQAYICIERQISALTHLHEVIQTKEYADLLATIIEVANTDYNRRVLIAGVGKNANIASKISETMASLGIPSFSLNVSHLGHGDYGMIGRNDIIIHISRSGSTSEMMIAMEHINNIRPSVKQFLIHCKKDKPKNNWAQAELFLGAVAEGDEFELAPTTSTTAILCILDCLSVQASQSIGFKRLDFLEYHPSGALGDMLKAEVLKSKPI